MTNAPLEIRPYRPADASAWQTYVQAHPQATVFHRMAWSRGVQEAYGHRPVHLTAWKAGRLAGVLPLFLVKSALVGRALVSVPYATYGGILADCREIAASILQYAKGLCAFLGAGYLELRHRDAIDLGLVEIDRYHTFRKPLPADVRQVLASLPRKARTAARHGLSALGPDAAEFGPELLDVVYDLYAATMRRLGSPNYRRGLFHALQDHYDEDCVCMVVKDKGRPVAGVVSYVFRDEIVPYFSGSLAEGMAKRANNVMYLRLMEYAVRRGLRRFDFNRTRRDNQGPYDFKRHHGFEPAPLHYQVFLRDGNSLPNLSPSSRKYALAGRIWRRLPLWLARPAGERITKWIP